MNRNGEEKGRNDGRDKGRRDGRKLVMMGTKGILVKRRKKDGRKGVKKR